MSNEETREKKQSRTAGEAGWHVSRYNLMTQIPDSKNIAIANLFKGNCAEYTPIEMYLLAVLEELDEHHPIIERFSKRGIISKIDEREALYTMGRCACAMPRAVGLTICPTMGCNFDCPYCFEDHRRGKMSAEVQDDVVALAERMLDASSAKMLNVTWFGGEPLLAFDVIESLQGRLMAAASERGAEYTSGIITNGYLLTQEIVDLLEAGNCKSMQVTIDGMGPTNDLTRRLAGGGGSFDRITNNLRTLKIPFKVSIRHNVHSGNKGEMEELRAFITQLAEESGNNLVYYPAPVSDSEAAEDRGEQVGLICGTDASEVGIAQEAYRFRGGRGHFCGAHTLWGVGIDDLGNLQKCWEAVDKPEISFGCAHDWDPMDPLNTASNPDNLTMYLNTALPLDDGECAECIWLPTCVGGCPNKRIFAKKDCVAFRNDPDSYVLALYRRIGEEKEKREKEEAKKKQTEE